VQYFCTVPASDGTDRNCRATVISAADSPPPARRSNLSWPPARGCGSGHILAGFEAIFFGAVGWPDVVPDHVSLWCSLLQFRRAFDQYVNLRPVKLMPGVRSPLAGREPGDVDCYIVRENTEGEYSSVGGRIFEGTEREAVLQETIMTRIGVDRILKYAFDLAQSVPAGTSPRRRRATGFRSPCRTGTNAWKRWRRAIPMSRWTSTTSTSSLRTS
jgi:hypothetical protein